MNLQTLIDDDTERDMNEEFAHDNEMENIEFRISFFVHILPSDN